MIDALLRCWLMIALGLFGVGAVFRNLQIAQQYDFLRTPCLIAEIISGSAVAFCFGAAMYYLDGILTQSSSIAWPWRLLLSLQKQLLLICQVAAMGMAVFSVGLMLFNVKIPGPNWPMLERTWTPPPETQP